jgi:succinate-acetate transporter protein
MEQNVADPGPLGLAAFAMTTFALSSANANLWHGAGVTAALSLAFFYGGIAQLLAGMWEFVRKNTFAALAFTSYGAFWLSFYAFVNWQKSASGLGVFLLGWAIFTVYMTIVATRTTNAILAVFVLLSLTFIFLTVGNWTGPNEHLQLVKIGGWLGLGTAGAAWYASLAGVYNATAGKVVFPVGSRG